MLAIEVFGLFFLVALAGVPLLYALLVATVSIIWIKGFGYPLETIFLSYISGVEPFLLANCCRTEGLASGSSILPIRCLDFFPEGWAS